METRRLLQILQRWISPLQHRVQLIVSRGVVRRVNDSTKLQEIQAELLKDEVRDGMERFQEFGFTSHPLPDAEIVVVFPGGSRDHGLVIAVDDRRYRIHVSEGNVAIYNSSGSYVHLNGDLITVKSATSVTLDAPDVYVRGDLHVEGDIEDRTILGGGSSMEDIRNDYNVHHHGNGNPPIPQMP